MSDQRRDLKNCCVVCRDYILISNFTVMTLIPFLLLSVFNYLLFKTIRHSGRINQKTSLRQKRDQKIAAILILLVTVFASCNCVRIVTNVYEVMEYGYFSDLRDVERIVPRLQVWNSFTHVASPLHLGVALELNIFEYFYIKGVKMSGPGLINYVTMNFKKNFLRKWQGRKGNKYWRYTLNSLNINLKNYFICLRYLTVW